jgi:hypothetical protein
MSRILKSRKLSEIFCTVAIGILAMQKVLGSEPYLQLVGPPPLRFEAITTPDPLFMEELKLPQPATPTPPDAAPPLTTSTNAQSSSTQPTGPTDVSAGKNPLGNFGDAAKNAENFPNPASDLLSITPQMITEYLKPNRNDGASDESGRYQPGQVVLVPAELGFVPPMPGGESRAIYRNQ